jgi:peptide/nickel transport system substrate-binding protein
MFVFILLVTIIGSSCKPSGGPVSSGTPNPPFEGTPPEDAYVFQGEPGVYGGQWVMAIPNEPKRFNIITAVETSSNLVLQNHVFRPLVDYRNGGANPDFEPGICSKWEASPDAKVWTFYLRKGVRWSDGEPFNADDVIFSYDLIKDTRVDTSLRDAFNEGKDATGKDLMPDLQKLDDFTVRFTLHQPNGAFLDAVINLFPVPKHKWEQAWRDGKFNEVMKVSDDPKDVVGLGPFRIKEFTSGQRVVLERNPFYWKVDKKGQRLPYLDRMIFIIARDFNTVTAKFQAGEIDGMDRIRGEEFSLVQKMESPDIKVEDVGITLDSYWMNLNQNPGTNAKNGKPYVEPWKLKLFRNQKFRQAISYAIDREGLANTVFAGRAVPIYSIVTPGDKMWYSDSVMKYPYNKDLAKQMLAEVGLKDTNGDSFLEDAEGHTIAITLNTNTGNSQREGTAAFIAKNLQDVGIKATSSPIDFNLIGDLLGSTYNYESIVLGWQSGVPPGMTNVKNVLLSSSQNHTFYPQQKTPATEWEGKIDELVKQTEQTLDPGERKKLYGEIQRIWSEQCAEIGLIAERLGVAYKSKFANVLPSTLPPRLTWNCDEIYIKK